MKNMPMQEQDKANRMQAKNEELDGWQHKQLPVIFSQRDNTHKLRSIQRKHEQLS